MSKETNTLIVGSTQGIQMCATFLRAKIISVFLGTTGFGIYSVLISSIMFFQQVGTLGLNQAAIKELSEANIASNDSFSDLKSKFHRIMLLLSLSVACLMAICSVPLSLVFFNDAHHFFYFLIASVGLGFYSITQSDYTIFQASKMLKTYAKVSLISSLATLIIAVILVPLFGLLGVPLSILLGYAFNAVMGQRENKDTSYRFHIKESIRLIRGEMRPIAERGVFIMLGAVSITAFPLALNGIISKSGMNEVGLYQAAAAVISQGLSVISIILATEFYPRISAIKGDEEIKVAYREEITMMLTLAVPIVIGLIWLSPIIVRILYSSEFIDVQNLIRIMCISVPFRAIWIVSGFLILSRGEKYSYFIYDGLIGNTLNFLCCVAGYYLNGLEGLAFGWLAGSVIVSLYMSVVTYCKYRVVSSIGQNSVTILFSLLCTSLLLLYTREAISNILNIISPVLFMTSALYCAHKFNIIKFRPH